MILINLLPHREEKRRRRKQAFFLGIGLAILAGALIAGAWYLVLGEMRREQRSRNEFLQTEIRRLESQCANDLFSWVVTEVDVIETVPATPAAPKTAAGQQTPAAPAKK